MNMVKTLLSVVMVVALLVAGTPARPCLALEAWHTQQADMQAALDDLPPCHRGQGADSTPTSQQPALPDCCTAVCLGTVAAVMPTDKTTALATPPHLPPVAMPQVDTSVLPESPLQPPRRLA